MKRDHIHIIEIQELVSHTLLSISSSADSYIHLKSVHGNGEASKSSAYFPHDFASNFDALE